MPFNPNLPLTDSEMRSAEMRNQFNGLKTLIDNVGAPDFSVGDFAPVLGTPTQINPDAATLVILVIQTQNTVKVAVEMGATAGTLTWGVGQFAAVGEVRQVIVPVPKGWYMRVGASGGTESDILILAGQMYPLA